MIPKYSFIIVFLLIGAKVCHAQNTYQQWLKQQNKEYNQYLSQQDSEFINFLKKNWIRVKVNKGINTFHKPKPQQPVVRKPARKPNESFKIPVNPKPRKRKKSVISSPKKSNGTLSENSKPSKNKINESGTNPVKKNVQKPANVPRSFVHNINYFDDNLSVIYNKKLNVNLAQKISNNSIADYWEKISKTKYRFSLKRALILDRNRKLNGWGYAKLLYDIGERITDGNRNATYLFTWFMLVKSGYLARVGFENNKVYLLISTSNKVYSTPYFYLHKPDGKFYVLLLTHDEHEPSKPMYTYRGSYPGKLHELSLGFNNLPELGNSIGKKVIHFSYQGKKFALPVEYNRNLIDFYHYYPHTNLAVYFSSKLSKAAQETLLPKLRKLIKGKTETQSANFILHFVQYATKYETDQKQFGWEKPFFPEESMYYPYSDCEDRAVLFSYLIQNLMGLKVIGLKYPDHVTTAVKFTVPMKGDYLLYKGQKYFICDPTYINASIGESMPRFRNVPAKIVYAH